MANFAKKTKCTYSRYADDLTFSTNRKEFPAKIAVQSYDNEWVLSTALKKEIEKVGFTVNEKKTSLQYKTARQIATGLVVNKQVNLYMQQWTSGCYFRFVLEFEIGMKDKLISPENSLLITNYRLLLLTRKMQRRTHQ